MQFIPGLEKYYRTVRTNGRAIWLVDDEKNYRSVMDHGTKQPGKSVQEDKFEVRDTKYDSA